MTMFEKREDAFEKKFVHDEQLRFKAEARRDKLVALWAADKLGKKGKEAEDYVNDVLNVDVNGSGERDVFRKIRGDFDRQGVALSDHQIHRMMDQFLGEALAEIRVTG